MTGSSFRYLLKDGTKNIWSNRLMSFASVGVLATCLLLVGFALLFTINVNSMAAYIEQQNEAVVFVEDKATDEQTDAVKLKLESNSNVFDVRFVSKQQALEEQKAALGEDAGLFDGLDEETFLPASFRIRIRDLSRMRETVQEIEGYTYVSKVNASLEMGAALSSAKRIINTAGSAIVIALIIVSLVIIANTIRASVFARRREINIMKYVGATDGFIRLPFVVEGLVLGLIAAVIAFLLIWLGYTVGVDAISGGGQTWLSALTEHLVPFSSVALPLGAAFAGAGMLTGALGSLLSIRNHLKV